MNIDDKRSEDERILGELVKRYIAEEEDGLTHEEREKIKRENRINAIKQWCAENPGRDPARAKDKTTKQLALDEKAVVRREKFRKNNPEKMLEIERRGDNKSKYRDNRQTYNERLPRYYLHKDSYETRLKKPKHSMVADSKLARLKVSVLLMNIQQSLNPQIVGQHLRDIGFALMGNNLLFHGLGGGRIYLLFLALVVRASHYSYLVSIFLLLSWTGLNISG
ncbi:hypothetical protein [Pseudoalteromonas sp. 31A1]|uniref:hypothetical protein n=1 Tax=Pseudoalteromonas sp. 31A1 TaxID=2686351 RepID=UPI001F0E3A07|nr:hypothetical protein [Pseudoalteromonas sp. 31A1]